MRKSLLVPAVALLCVLVAGCSQEPDFTEQAVQEGFRKLPAGSYKEQSGDGPLRLVDRYRNEGEAARSATFVLTLREDEEGRTVWVGRATATDLEPGEEFVVTYEGDEPVPDGDQYLQWRVEDVVRGD
jgi:hypothetical protein